MNRALAVLLAFSSVARAELYLYNSRLGQSVPELPAYIRPIDVATTNHGWTLPTIPVQDYPAAYDPASSAWVPWSLRDTLQDAAVVAVTAKEQQRMDREWPLLTEHPATNEIPAGGLTYRLDDGTNKTFWVARQGDLLATQISAHNEQGDEITRTVNLKTGEDVTINLRKLTEATKWSDLKNAKSVKTNKVKKAKSP